MASERPADRPLSGFRRRRSCDRGVARSVPIRRPRRAAGRGGNRVPRRRESSIGPDGFRGPDGACPTACATRLESLRGGSVARAQRRRLPARGGARAEARDRAAAAGQARDRPDRAGHPPRPHGRAPEAARVPGPRPRGGADHRGLHGPRRRSQRPLGHAAGAVAARRSTPTPAPSRSRRSTVLDPDRTRSASTASGSTCRWSSCSGSRARRPSASCSSATTSPSAWRATRRSRCSSCSTRCSRATTRSRSAPTSSSAAPTRSSTCCSGATSSAPTASPSRRS